MAELKEQTESESRLDEMIAKLEQQKQNLKSDPSYTQFAYVTHEDLKRVQWCKRSDHSLVFIVQTPHGSLLNIFKDAPLPPG